jgi:hypothetical protein
VYVIDTRIKRRALRNWLVLQSVSHGSDNLVSYFEIGGHIHECESYDPATAGRLEVLSAVEITREFARALPGKTRYKNSGSPMPKPKPGVKLARNLSRAGRAHRALVVAGTVAAADGPLPVGDMIAIGILSAYAGYETYRILDDVL